MKKLKIITVILALAFLLLTQNCFAQKEEQEVSSFLGAFLSLLSLIIVGWSFFLCLKIGKLVKGGEISFSWRLFLGGFSFFALAEILEFLSLAGFFSISHNLILFFKLIALIVLGLGVYLAKKVLS
jgi:hypothetical protein